MAMYEEIGRLLKLENSPVAICLEEEQPSSRKRFMGYAPASCSFWRLGIDYSFYTLDSDHNCSIGKVTHGFRSADEVKENDDVRLLTSIGWISMDEISKLPRLPKSMVISYIPVDKLKVEGSMDEVEVVKEMPNIALITFFCNAEQVMLVVDAAERAGIEYRIRSRPTCAILAEAYSIKGVVIGLGCTPSRLRTPYSTNDLFVAVHPSIVDRLVEHLSQVVKVEEFLYANKAMLV
ncbi:MAG: DUF169 domain-containing protein [Candidatus Nitrosocaldus sp.]